MQDQETKTMAMDMQLLISLMANAYGQGLKAGQHTATMKDNPDFAQEAVSLFASGLSDSLCGMFGRTVH